VRDSEEEEEEEEEEGREDEGGGEESRATAWMTRQLYRFRKVAFFSPSDRRSMPWTEARCVVR